MLAPVALAAPVQTNLTAGEMYGHIGGYTGNAYTAPKGGLYLHPFVRSTVGVTERIDVKISPLGWIAGPNAHLEFAPIQNEDMAFSIEPGLIGVWSPVLVGYTNFFRFSKVAGNGLFNLSLGLGGTFGNATLITGTQINDTLVVDNTDPVNMVRPEVGYDFNLTDRSRLVVTGRTNLIGLTRGVANGSIGAMWFYGSEQIGASLGVNVMAGGLDPESVALLNQAGMRVPAIVVLPLPHAQIWYRL